MGIPGYARIIIKKYPKIYNKTENVNFLFMDYNSLMYFVKNNLMDKENKLYEIGKLSDTKYEKILINKILDYTKHIITDIVKPNKLVYIALDGTPPFAKMVQQRLRRFKKKKDYDIEKLVYGKNKKQWNTNNFTPGTNFMFNFSNKMQKFINDNNFSTHLDRNLRVIFSDSSVPGEGEHKLIPYIRKLKVKNTDTFGIYGMDADLIVLSMLTDKNIFIINETDNRFTNDTSEFMSLNVNMFKNYFMKELELDNYDHNNIIHDYVFLTFLGGNDFVKSIRFLKIRDGGLDIMLKIYKKILNNRKDFLITNDFNINSDFFKQLINDLSNIEDSNLKIIQKKINSFKHNHSYDPDDEKEKIKSYYQHTFYYDEVNPYYKKLKPLFDKLNFLKKYKNNYYDLLFELNPITDDYLNTICKEYLISLIWTLKYYLTGKVPNWKWSYPFRAAPLLVDFNNYLSKNNYDDEFKEEKPYLPLQQLMFVLPPTDKKILPKKYLNLMINDDSPIIEFYPDDFELDYLDGLKYIYSEPVLPDLDTDLIIDSIKKIKLTIKEKKRNKINDTPVYFNFGNGKISNSNRTYK